MTKVKKITSESMFHAAQEIEYTGVFTYQDKIGCFFLGEAKFYPSIDVASNALDVFRYTEMKKDEH